MTKSPKNPESKRRPTVRQAAFVDGILDGKSSRRAALDAGYAKSSADHANDEIMGSAERSFGPALRKAIPVSRIIKRLREGLDAVVVKVATYEGKITDEKAYVDHAERRAYAELIVKLSGYYVPTQRLEMPERESKEDLIAKILGESYQRGEATKEPERAET